jgi:hypothetical protein
LEHCGRQGGGGEIELGPLAIGDMPRLGQAGEGQRPFDQSPPAYELAAGDNEDQAWDLTFRKGGPDGTTR